MIPGHMGGPEVIVLAVMVTMDPGTGGGNLSGLGTESERVRGNYFNLAMPLN